MIVGGWEVLECEVSSGEPASPSTGAGGGELVAQGQFYKWRMEGYLYVPLFSDVVKKTTSCSAFNILKFKCAGKTGGTSVAGCWKSSYFQQWFSFQASLVHLQ